MEPIDRPVTTAVDGSSGLDHDGIRQQLARILSSPEFHATDRVRDFLRFVVEEKLAGRSHRLKGYTIAVQVFGRSEDFDATNDPIVRIQAGRLRRALERYYLVAGVGDPILIDVPKGRYIPRFAARPAAPASPAPIPGQPASTQALPAAPAPDDLPVTTGPSVAVLPFENLSGDPAQLALTVGLTEELVTELTRFQDIAVVPCHLAQQPAGTPQDPVELARAVGARFLLRGAARRDAETVKVSAQLIDTGEGRQIWADASTHPPDASELIATQEEIAQRVVSSIASEYGIIARRLSAESRKRRPAELATYEAMLRYYSHQIAPTLESAAECFSALSGATEREPEYAPAWSALATLYCQMYAFDAPGFDNALGTALEHAHRGVSLDPGLQLARLILAYASHLADEPRSFEQEAEAALALNPNSPYTVGTIGYIHALRGEIERGLPLVQRAMVMNPCHPAWFHAAFVIDHWLRAEWDIALAESRRHRPFISFWDDVAMAAMLGKLGRSDEAGPHVDRVMGLKPDFPRRARKLIRRALKIDPVVDELMDGLRRAGMPVEPTDRSPITS